MPRADGRISSVMTLLCLCTLFASAGQHAMLQADILCKRNPSWVAVNHFQQHKGHIRVPGHLGDLGLTDSIMPPTPVYVSCTFSACTTNIWP